MGQRQEGETVRTVSEIMTPDPLVLGPEATAIDAARAMRDVNIGSVLVVDGAELVGIVTDRDIVLRVIAENVAPGSAMLSSISTPVDVVAAPGDLVADVVRLMRDRAVRRVPVVDGGVPVGIVSLGDLAIEQNHGSVLADISAAAPDRL